MPGVTFVPAMPLVFSVRSTFWTDSTTPQWRHTSWRGAGCGCANAAPLARTAAAMNVILYMAWLLGWTIATRRFAGGRTPPSKRNSFFLRQQAFEVAARVALRVRRDLFGRAHAHDFAA